MSMDHTLVSRYTCMSMLIVIDVIVYFLVLADGYLPRWSDNFPPYNQRRDSGWRGVTDSEDMTDGESVYIPRFLHHTSAADSKAAPPISVPNSDKVMDFDTNHPQSSQHTPSGQDGNIVQSKKRKRLYGFNLPSSGRLRTRSMEVSEFDKIIIHTVETSHAVSCSLMLSNSN